MLNVNFILNFIVTTITTFKENMSIGPIKKYRKILNVYSINIFILICIDDLSIQGVYLDLAHLRVTLQENYLRAYQTDPYNNPRAMIVKYNSDLDKWEYTYTTEHFFNITTTHTLVLCYLSETRSERL